MTEADSAGATELQGKYYNRNISFKIGEHAKDVIILDLSSILPRRPCDVSNVTI